MIVTMDTPPLYELGFLTILLTSHSYDSTYMMQSNVRDIVSIKGMMPDEIEFLMNSTSSEVESKNG